MWSVISDGAAVLYLWYEVQESISWEGSHCQAHKQLQDQRVRFLAGAEEDQADAEHGAHCDEQDSSRAVAIFCREEAICHVPFRCSRFYPIVTPDCNNKVEDDNKNNNNVLYLFIPLYLLLFVNIFTELYSHKDIKYHIHFIFQYAPDIC